MTDREKAALDRFLTDPPDEDFFTLPCARPVPDSAIAMALRAQIGETWRRMHQERYERDVCVEAWKASSLDTEYYRRMALRGLADQHNRQAGELHDALCVVIDIWRRA